MSRYTLKQGIPHPQNPGEYGFTENDYTVMWSDSKNGNAVEFEKNADYILVTQKKETNNPKNPVTEFTDYQISIDMAKQICMRDWRLELNSQSGFQGCVSTVFSIKWTI